MTQIVKFKTIATRLDKGLDKLLREVVRQSDKSRSEMVREALRRQLRVSLFDGLRRRIAPFAEARGYLTDEDVFRDVS